LARLKRNFGSVLCTKRKNLKSSLKTGKISLELTPSHFVWDTVSLIYMKFGEYQEVIAAEEKVIELSPYMLVMKIELKKLRKKYCKVINK